MPRWRQDAKTGKMVPIDEAARKHDGVYIHGDIERFVSSVDGSIISDRNQLREHNKRNNVVDATEFTPEFYAGKAKERADFFEGNRTRQESLTRKQEIYEITMRHERNGR